MAHNLRAVSISTGLGVQSHRIGSGAPVSALRFDKNTTLFASDNTGSVIAMKFSPLTGEISILSTYTTSLKAPISSLNVRTLPLLTPEPPGNREERFSSSSNHLLTPPPRNSHLLSRQYHQAPFVPIERQHLPTQALVPGIF